MQTRCLAVLTCYLPSASLQPLFLASFIRKCVLVYRLYENLWSFCGGCCWSLSVVVVHLKKFYENMEFLTTTIIITTQSSAIIGITFSSNFFPAYEKWKQHITIYPTLKSIISSSKWQQCITVKINTTLLSICVDANVYLYSYLYIYSSWSEQAFIL